MTKAPLTGLDKSLRDVVEEAYLSPFSTKGDFARKYADVIAMAASMQLITTKLTGNVYSREWRPTSLGVMYLDQLVAK